MTTTIVSDAEELRKVVETDVAEIAEDDYGNPEQVNEYALKSVLGEGAFAQVWLCEKQRDGDKQLEQYAMKVFNKSILNKKREFSRVNGKMVMSTAFQKVQKEVAIMKKLSHLNLTKLHEVIDNPENDKLFLVLELVSGGQIMDWDETKMEYRRRNTNDLLSDDEARKCVCDLVLAIEYLHANRICHRDIKPENILVTENTTYKLADFGVAHMFSDEELDMKLRNTEGTFYFLAPECTTGEDYDAFKVDLWALGITLYCLVSGTVPFGVLATGMQGIIDAIRNEETLHFSSNVSEGCQDLIQKLLVKDPSKRISLIEVKEHPWLDLNTHREGKDLAPPLPVNVSPEDILLAFTPVNNFIMMSVIKMKMANKLAAARKRIDVSKTVSKDIENMMVLKGEEGRGDEVVTEETRLKLVTCSKEVENPESPIETKIRNEETSFTTIKKTRNCLIS